MRTNPIPAQTAEGDPFRALVAQFGSGIARCRAVFDGTAVVDLDILEANAAFLELTGAATVVGLRFSDLVRDRELDARASCARAGRVLAGGRPEHAETYLGGRGLFSTTFRLALDEVAVVLEDATRSKRADQGGVHGEPRVAAAFQANAEALVISRCADLRVVDVNDRMLALIGMPRSRVVGRTPDELGLATPDYVRARIDELGDPAATYTRQREVVVTPPDGEPRTLLASAQLIELDDEPCALTTFIDITERKRAEAAFETLFRSAPAGLLLVQAATTTIVDANDRLLAMSGYSREELVGKPPFAVEWLRQGEASAASAAFARHGRVGPLEVRLRRKDGRTRTALASAESLVVRGEPHRLSSFIDITERVRGEQWLAAHHAIHRLLGDAADLPAVASRVAEALCRGDDWDFGAIWLVGPDGRLRCSGLWHRPELGAAHLAEATRTLAMGAGEGVLGRVLVTRAVEMIEVSPATFLRAEAALACGLHHATAFPIVLREGVVGVVDLLAREHGELTPPLVDLFGAIGHTLALFIERTRTVAELRMSEDRLRGVIEALNEGVVIADPAVQHHYVNPAARRMHGLEVPPGGGPLPRSQVLFEATTLAGDVLAPESWPMRRILRGEKLRDVELRVKYRDTGVSRVYAFSGSLVPRADGRHMGVLSISDITERVEATLALRELNADLERRVQARTQELVATNRELEAFSYSVSHDLRAPLRAINGFVDIVLDEHAPDLSPDARLLLGRVRDGGRRMTAMIEDLLALAQVGRAAIRPSAIDVDALVADVVDEVRRTRAGGDRVVVRIAPLPRCQADASLVRQVWTNLIDNAFKYTGRQATPVIDVTSERAGDEVVYAVRDNGVGFDPAHAPRLFGAFQRLHPASEFEGTGVGLANVSRIVERHGGRVWAESVPGAGAVFRFTLGAPVPRSSTRS